MRRHNLLWSLVILLAASTGAAADWQFQPAGVPLVHSIAADSSGQRLWLSTYGGFWRSENGGASWTPLSALSAQMSYYAGALTVADPGGDTLLLAGQHQHLRYSFDGGATWAVALDSVWPDFQGQVVVWPGDRRVWFYESSGLVYRTTNAGQNWEALTTGFSPVHYSSYAGGPFLYPSLYHDSTIFAATYHDTSPFTGNGHIWRSDDVGSTWMQIGVADCWYDDYWTGLVELADGRLVISGTSTPNGHPGFRSKVSTDNGQTWQPWAAFPDIAAQPYSVIEDAAIPGRLYAAGNFPGGFLRSLDNGITWVANDDLPVSVSEGRLHVEPYSGTFYLIPGDAGVFRSTDRGDTWQPVNLPLIGEGVWRSAIAITQDAVYYQRAITTTLWETFPRRCWRLETNGAAWHPLELLPVFEFTWWPAMSPMLRDDGDTLVYLFTDRWGWQDISYRALSTDDGATWATSPLPVVFEPAITWTPPDGAGQKLAVLRAYSSGSNRDSVLLSDDGGSSWRPAADLEGLPFVLTVQWGASTLWLGTSDGNMEGTAREIHRSYDGGGSWQQIGTTFDNAVLLALLADSAYALQMGTGILHCWTDSLWQPRGTLPVLPDQFYATSFLAIDTEPPLLLAARYDTAEVWLSDDRGYTWRSLNAALPYAEVGSWIRQLVYDAPRGRLWASTGVGTAYLDVSEIAHSSGPLTWKPADYTVLSCYPNPFNSSARIRYDLLQAGRVELTLYDLQGRRVKTLVDEIVGAGRHEARVEGNGLASGTYFVKLHTATTTHTEKILLLK